MKKYILAVIAALLLVLGLTGCSSGRCEIESCKNKKMSGEDYCVEHAYSFSDNYNEITINGYTGNNSDVKLPKEINGKKVTKIGSYAFTNFTGMTSVSIPSTIVSIDAGAFSGCTGLTSLSLPDSITYLGASCFENCSGLTKVEIPGSISVSNGQDVSGIFANCSNLSEVVFTGDIKEIYPAMFNQCNAITEITIPKSVTTIGNYAFANCASLKKVTIDGDVDNLGAGCFAYCNCLESVVFNGAIPCVSTEMFSGCTSLSEIKLPDSVQSIGSSAFEQCSSLKHMDIPGSVSSIGNYAFANCSQLENVEFPSSLMYLDDRAFSGCGMIDDVVLPNSLVSLGSNVFSGTSIDFLAIPDNITSFKYDMVAGIKNVVLGTGITRISPDCFEGSNLETIEMNGHITSVEYDGFKDCRNLKSVKFNGGVEYIGDISFIRCTSLIRVDIGPTDKLGIGHQSFEDCENLEYIVADTSIDKYSHGIDPFRNSPALLLFKQASDENRIYDEFHEISATQIEELNAIIDTIQKKHYCDAAIAVVSGTDGRDIKYYAESYYDKHSFGVDEPRSGVLLMVDLEGREWHMCTTGLCNLFTSEDLDKISEKFSPELSASNWYQAYKNFFSSVLEVLDEEFTPLSSEIGE